MAGKRHWRHRDVVHERHRRDVGEAGVGNIPTNWSVAGVADFNGDGIGDLLWRDSSGDLAVWLMNSATVMSSAALGNVPNTWMVVGAGDFNGDGMADILWQDNLGNTSIWFMNGTTVASAASVGNIPTVWSVVARATSTRTAWLISFGGTRPSTPLSG
jgi:hypothetical protein